MAAAARATSAHPCFALTAAERAVVAAELARLSARVANLAARLDRLHAALAGPDQPASPTQMVTTPITRVCAVNAGRRAAAGGFTEDPGRQVSQAGHPGSPHGEAVSSGTATSRPGPVTAQAARPCQ
jgi:predicted trehalose synthase